MIKFLQKKPIKINFWNMLIFLRSLKSGALNVLKVSDSVMPLLVHVELFEKEMS